MGATTEQAAGTVLGLLSKRATACLEPARRLSDAVSRLGQEAERLAVSAGEGGDPRALWKAAGAARALLDLVDEQVLGVEEGLEALSGTFAFPVRWEGPRVSRERASALPEDPCVEGPRAR